MKAKHAERGLCASVTMPRPAVWGCAALVMGAVVFTVFLNSANIMRMYTKLVLNDPVERPRYTAHGARSMICNEEHQPTNIAALLHLEHMVSILRYSIR